LCIIFSFLFLCGGSSHAGLVAFNNEAEGIWEIFAFGGLPLEVIEGRLITKTVGPAFREFFGRAVRLVGNEGCVALKSLLEFSG